MSTDQEFEHRRRIFRQKIILSTDQEFEHRHRIFRQKLIGLIRQKINKMIQISNEVVRRGGVDCTTEELRLIEDSLLRVRGDATPAQQRRIDRIREHILAYLDEA